MTEAKRPQRWPTLPILTEVGTSVIPPRFKGVILVTGQRGSGKTTFGLIDDPKQTFFLDFEKKGEGYHDSLGFGGYVDVPTQVIEFLGGETDVEMIYDRTRDLIAGLPAGRFSNLLIDNVDPLIKGMEAKIKNSESLQRSYGLKPKNVTEGAWGGAWPGISWAFGQLVNLAHSRGIKVVTVIAHVGDQWLKDGVVPNKFRVTNLKKLHELSMLTLVMLPSHPERDDALYDELGIEAGHPIAAVMKESLSRKVWDPVKGRVITKRSIPPRISPGAIWRIWGYMENPCDFSNLKPYEQLLVEEIAPYSPIISKEQIAFIQSLAVLTRAQMESKMKEGVDGEEGGE
ncbi:MAG: ATP-binding protein [Nitrospira sp.]|nr:ATP-binding protein [Nitrospira sp.]